MTDGIDMSAGDILVAAGGVVKFSAAKPQFRRVPQGEIDLGSAGSPYSITFPSFVNQTAVNGSNYFYATFSFFPDTAEQCTTTGRLVQQEWGPTAASPFTLPDIDVGAAPAGCDYLDVQVNLTRTTAPSIPSAAGAFPVVAGKPIFESYPWPIEIIESQWLDLQDAAIVLERINGMARMLWFEIVSGRVLLRRKQSVASIGFETHLIDSRVNNPSNGSLTAAHANGSGCITTNLLDSTSVYSGQIKITPCITS